MDNKKNAALNTLSNIIKHLTATEIRQALRILSQDEAWYVRAAASIILEETIDILTEEEIFFELGTLLEDKAEEVRKAVAKILPTIAKAYPQSLFEKLKFLLQLDAKKNWKIRHYATIALGKVVKRLSSTSILAASILELIIPLLAEKFPIDKMAASILQKMIATQVTEQQAFTMLWPLLNSDNVKIKLAAVKALRSVPKENVDEVLKLLEDLEQKIIKLDEQETVLKTTLEIVKIISIKEVIPIITQLWHKYKWQKVLISQTFLEILKTEQNRVASLELLPTLLNDKRKLKEIALEYLDYLTPIMPKPVLEFLLPEIRKFELYEHNTQITKIIKKIAKILPEEIVLGLKDVIPMLRSEILKSLGSINFAIFPVDFDMNMFPQMGYLLASTPFSDLCEQFLILSSESIKQHQLLALLLFKSFFHGIPITFNQGSLFYFAAGNIFQLKLTDKQHLYAREVLHKICKKYLIENSQQNTKQGSGVINFCQTDKDTIEEKLPQTTVNQTLTQAQTEKSSGVMISDSLSSNPMILEDSSSRVVKFQEGTSSYAARLNINKAKLKYYDAKTEFAFENYKEAYRQFLLAKTFFKNAKKEQGDNSVILNKLGKIKEFLEKCKQLSPKPIS